MEHSRAKRLEKKHKGGGKSSRNQSTSESRKSESQRSSSTPSQENARDGGPGHGHKHNGSVPDQDLGLDLWNTVGLGDWKRNTTVVVKVLDTSPQVSNLV